MQCFVTQNINAQATLSIQGILKRANGDAVDDGAYTITFRLYEQESGSTSTAIWTETQNDVDVFNGIYSAVLGQTTALNVPFDQLYYLGVTIGSSELSPRILLTSAPYALSLIGSTNQFPSSGKVLADSVLVNGGIKVTAGIPGLNGINQKGYSFAGDGDTGLFSSSDGNVSIYSDNVEKLAVTPTNLEVKSDMNVTGNFTSEGVTLTNNSSISYAAGNDWRLVETDYFETDSEGWNVYTPKTGEFIGWNNPTANAISPTNWNGNSGFAGQALVPANNDDVLKKQFTIPGSFTYIRVKFKYHFLDNWELTIQDHAFAGLASSAAGTDLRILWNSLKNSVSWGNQNFQTPDFLNQTNYVSGIGSVDQSIDVEMTGKALNGSNSFWVIIGAGLNEGTANENYAIGFVEVWVK